MYYLAARFTDRIKTVSPYASIRVIIYLEQRDQLLSCRFSRDGYWYIVVIGEKPPFAIHKMLISHMNRGTRMRIDDASCARLFAKLEQKRKQKERQP